jgi:hypothetical protein
MTTIQCGSCGREITRGNYVGGVIVCAACAMEEMETPPAQKNVTRDWHAFSTVKRRKRAWR